MIESEEEKTDRIVEILGNALSFTVNEAVVIQQLEEFFSPKPAALATTKDEQKKIEKRILNLQRKLGGPPKLIITFPDEETPVYDTYPMAALNEIISTYHRCRRSICRTYMYCISIGLFEKIPGVLNLPDNEEENNTLKEVFVDRFWEHAETSYIRLASLWDRIGQLLDFVFFNIRQFEREGFPSVISRIKSNYIPMNKKLSESENWKKLNAYQSSEKKDGLAWLLRRRNLLVHSLHLRAFIESDGQDPIYICEYNHLDEKMRNKLAPGTMEEELNYLHTHLSIAVNLFDDVLGLCEQGLEILPRKVKKEGGSGLS